MELATGYWASSALLAANELGVFSALEVGERSAAQVANTIGADERATEMLLNACCGLGLIERGSSGYRLTPAAAAFLTPGSPGYLGAALAWSRDQYEAWGRLAQSVRTGAPVVEPQDHLGADPEQTRTFVLGMHQRALGIARGVVPFMDLSGCRSLLDIGGGPGTFAVLLSQTYPDLRATVLDLPGVVAIARELIEQAGLADRVLTLAGDATSGDYGERVADAVLFSGVLHQMGPATIRRMFAGARRALVPGGRVIVSDMMLDETRTRPAFSTLFSLQMLLTSREGAVFSEAECAAWLGEAGCEDIRIRKLPPPLPYSIVTAVAP
jgi:SAM-dependent methyltransferase